MSFFFDAEGLTLVKTNKFTVLGLKGSLNAIDDEEIIFESDEVTKYSFVSEPLKELL